MYLAGRCRDSGVIRAVVTRTPVNEVSLAGTPRGTSGCDGSDANCVPTLKYKGSLYYRHLLNGSMKNL